MKKPFLYALAAVLYIVIIVFGINFIDKFLPEETLLIPMAMLSLFVLSAAIMGFLFLSEPLQLFLENRKKEAITFFFQIVGIFACFIILLTILLFLI